MVCVVGILVRTVGVAVGGMTSAIGIVGVVGAVGMVCIVVIVCAVCGVCGVYLPATFNCHLSGAFHRN